MNQIEIFNSPEFGSIRTLEQNGKVLFCGTDVATALGYTNPRKAVRDHTRGGTKCSIGVQTGKKADGSPAVQMVEMLFIPEGDLYRLIAHSSTCHSQARSLSHKREVVGDSHFSGSSDKALLRAAC